MEITKIIKRQRYVGVKDSSISFLNDRIKGILYNEGRYAGLTQVELKGTIRGRNQGFK